MKEAYAEHSEHNGKFFFQLFIFYVTYKKNYPNIRLFTIIHFVQGQR